ncbi:MAG: YdcF family protein [Lachnospiraceae bacterium]|nr:YdcF family protein [Lachnospiraceae bacterium]
MRSVLETGCFLAGILILFYYVGVVLYAGLRASFAWFWLLSGSALILFRFALHYQDLHPGTPLRFVNGAILVLMAAALAVVLVLAGRIVLAMHFEDSSEKDPSYVIVLGAQVKGTSPSRALKRRLDRAAQYAREHPDAVLILSGGQGPDEGISEAECMYRYLVEAGVSRERLLMEDQSTSTQENLEFSAKIILQRTNDTENCEPTAIISNDFHIYRALLLAGKAGYRNAFGVPADSDVGMLPHNIMREICALLVSYARGIL